MRSIVKKAAKNAGLDEKLIWPHCLRSSFYNMLVGKVDDVEREFMFGHVMGVRSHYFAPQWVEKLRSAYLSVGWGRTGTRITREEVRAEVIKALMGKISDSELTPIAEKLGISLNQIRSMIKRIREEGREEETEALLEQERKQRRKTMKNGGECERYESKLVTEEKLTSHINQGWDLVKELSSGKILIKRTLRTLS